MLLIPWGSNAGDPASGLNSKPRIAWIAASVFGSLSVPADVSLLSSGGAIGGVISFATPVSAADCSVGVMNVFLMNSIVVFATLAFVLFVLCLGDLGVFENDLC